MKTYQEKVDRINNLQNELLSALKDLKKEYDVDYQFQLQSQTSDGDSSDVWQNYESSDWDASWC